MNRILLKLFSKRIGFRCTHFQQEIKSQCACLWFHAIQLEWPDSLCTQCQYVQSVEEDCLGSLEVMCLPFQFYVTDMRIAPCFAWLSNTSDLKTGAPAATLPGAWYHKLWCQLENWLA